LTLTNRLNVFFLSALAFVLAGFSIALYLFARHHLHRQADERLEAALSILTAAVEITPEGLEWEPSDRQMGLGSVTAEDSIVWLVIDPEGREVNRAGPAKVANFVSEITGELQTTQRGNKRCEREGTRWEFRQLWMESPNPVASPQPSGDKERKYPALGITVGLSYESIRTTLQELAAVLAGLSGAIWFAAMIAGRIICRQALRPVTQMATLAHDMDTAALDRRLPLISSGDELEDLVRAFNGLLDRMQDAFERQRRFTGDASHQLRTPLAALLGQVEVALRRERPSEEYKRVLGSVLQQADRLQLIVESLLFLARADAEAQLPQRERIDLALWLPTHLQAWSNHPRAGDIVTEITPAWVHAHPVLLGELLNILLDNALKHSSPGNAVTIRIHQTAEVVELSVADVGSGISEEDLQHLFEPFFRSPSVRLRGIEGFGLGLAVAKRIADAFGGTLTVTSQVGQGSRFLLRLAAAKIEGETPEGRK
jgi:heavy metal sensor kinase